MPDHVSRLMPEYFNQSCLRDSRGVLGSRKRVSTILNEAVNMSKFYNWYNVSKGLEEFFHNGKHIVDAYLRPSVKEATWDHLNKAGL